MAHRKGFDLVVNKNILLLVQSTYLPHIPCFTLFGVRKLNGVFLVNRKIASTSG